MLKNPLETGNHANSMTNGLSAETERDKSRPYAYRQTTGALRRGKYRPGNSYSHSIVAGGFEDMS